MAMLMAPMFCNLLGTSKKDSRQRWPGAEAPSPSRAVVHPRTSSYQIQQLELEREQLDQQAKEQEEELEQGLQEIQKERMERLKLLDQELAETVEDLHMEIAARTSTVSAKHEKAMHDIDRARTRLVSEEKTLRQGSPCRTRGVHFHSSTSDFDHDPGSAFGSSLSKCSSFNTESGSSGWFGWCSSSSLKNDASGGMPKSTSRCDSCADVEDENDTSWHDDVGLSHGMRDLSLGSDCLSTMTSQIEGEFPEGDARTLGFSFCAFHLPCHFFPRESTGERADSDEEDHQDDEEDEQEAEMAKGDEEEGEEEEEELEDEPANTGRVLSRAKKRVLCTCGAAAA